MFCSRNRSVQGIDFLLISPLLRRLLLHKVFVLSLSICAVLGKQRTAHSFVRSLKWCYFVLHPISLNPASVAYRNLALALTSTRNPSSICKLNKFAHISTFCGCTCCEIMCMVQHNRGTQPCRHSRLLVCPRRGRVAVVAWNHPACEEHSKGRQRFDYDPSGGRCDVSASYGLHPPADLCAKLCPFSKSTSNTRGFFYCAACCRYRRP